MQETSSKKSPFNIKENLQGLDDLPGKEDMMEEIEKEETAREETSPMIKGEGQVEGTSGFILEMMICSILLWSLVFLKASPQGQSFLQEVNKKVEMSSTIEVVETFQTALTKVIAEIL